MNLAVSGVVLGQLTSCGTLQGVPTEAIHAAAFWGLTSLIRRLLTVTEDPDVVDGYGRTPLSCAAQNMY